ncbi:hypothetical protein HK102_007122 [Quaeritorhiza haematococci]|nr:hypothetical protein HK102_007122 [Quaeritorhiza haematococci]
MPVRTTDDCPMHNLFGSKALNLEPQMGDAALQHLNHPEYADIILNVKDAGTFFAHRAYLTRSDRFKSYAEKETFVEGSAPVINITAPIPKILLDWFCADRFAESLCTADYFMLEDIKKEAIGKFPTLWKVAIASSFLAPKWIPSEIVSELMASEEITAADKIRVIGAWFGRGDYLSPDADAVLSNCSVDESMAPQSICELRKELGPLVFNRVVPGSYVGEIYERCLTQLRAEANTLKAEANTFKSTFKSTLEVWKCNCGDYRGNYLNQPSDACGWCSQKYNQDKVVTNISPWSEWEILERRLESMTVD